MAHLIKTNVYDSLGNTYEGTVIVKHLPDFSYLDKLSIIINLKIWKSVSAYQSNFGEINPIISFDNRNGINSFIKELTVEQATNPTKDMINGFALEYLEGIYGEGNIEDIGDL